MIILELILQFLSFLILLPLSVLMLVLFNIYTNHAVYFLLVTVFAALYAALWGLVFMSVIPIYVVFSAWLVLYVMRMSKLKKKYKFENRIFSTPILLGEIKLNPIKLKIKFIFPLSFFKFFKLLPKSASIKISHKLGVVIQIPKLIDEILLNSSGTHVGICTEQADVQLTIQ